MHRVSSVIDPSLSKARKARMAVFLLLCSLVANVDLVASTAKITILKALGKGLDDVSAGLLSR